MSSNKEFWDITPTPKRDPLVSWSDCNEKSLCGIWEQGRVNTNIHKHKDPTQSKQHVYKIKKQKHTNQSKLNHINLPFDLQQQ